MNGTPGLKVEKRWVLARQHALQVLAVASGAAEVTETLVVGGAVEVVYLADGSEKREHGVAAPVDYEGVERRRQWAGTVLGDRCAVGDAMGRHEIIGRTRDADVLEVISDSWSPKCCGDHLPEGGDHRSSVRGIGSE